MASDHERILGQSAQFAGLRPIRADRIAIHGLIYEVETGRLRTVD